MSRRRLVVVQLVLLGAAAAAAPPEAAAQTQTGPTATTPVPTPKPQGGRMSIRVVGGLPTRRVRYFARGQRVIVVGTVRPFVPGQLATVELVRKRRVRARYRARISPTRGGAGRFVVRFVPRRRGRLRLVARHERSDRQAAFRAGSKRVRVVRWRAGQGASGTKVLLLQRALRSLGFATPVSGRYDAGTSRAVLAYRKTNHMGRTGYASAGVYGKVLRRRGRFRLRYPRAGRHVEFDWSRQVLVLANRGRAYRTYHASSGKPSTPTVFGSFRFYRKQPGTNSHGMVHSSYFVGGYAIHGYASVPNYPASHGCIRIPIPNSRQVYDWIPRGMAAFVYR